MNDPKIKEPKTQPSYGEHIEYKMREEN